MRKNRIGRLVTAAVLVLSALSFASCKQATGGGASGSSAVPMAAFYTIDSFENVSGTTPLMGASTLPWAPLTSWNSSGESDADIGLASSTDWASDGSRSLKLGIKFTTDAAQTKAGGVNNFFIGQTSWDYAKAAGIYPDALLPYLNGVKKVSFDYKWVPDATSTATNKSIKIHFGSTNVTSTWGSNIDATGTTAALAAGTGTAIADLSFVNNNDGDDTVATPAGSMPANARPAALEVQIVYGGDVGTTAQPGADIADAGLLVNGTLYIDNVRYLTSTTVTLDPPTFTPTVKDVGTGSLLTTDTITLADATTGTTIYYTTDGSTPTTASTKYTAPFTLPAGSSTVKAIATASGYTTSGVASATYTVVAAVPDPTAGTAAGAINSYDGVTLASSIYGATIYYTTDGSTPTTSSNVYASAIYFTDVTAGTVTKTLKFFAKKGAISSNVVSVAYDVTYVKLTPISNFTFTDANQVFTGSSIITDGAQGSVLSVGVTATGNNWSDFGFAYTTPVDASAVTSVSMKLKGSLASGQSWWSGNHFQLQLLDASGNKFNFADVVAGTDFNDTAYTAVALTVAKGSADSSNKSTFDFHQISRVSIWCYCTGTLNIGSISFN